MEPTGEVDRRRIFSESKLKLFREELALQGLSIDCTVVINGSFARREASEQSDVDYFVLHQLKEKSSKHLEDVKAAVNDVITKCGLKPPSAGGAFARPEHIDDFLSNVGGMNDPNEKLTRRMLFMLEGDWLTQSALFHSFREQLITKVYAKQVLSSYALARFFLNDLIRYWRTIGVDFENKTVEKGKAWGTRNLKLVFSRKLLYFSGLLMAAETAQRTPKAKAKILIELSSLDPVSRIQKLVGPESRKALGLYGQFLECVSDKDFRALADNVELEGNRPEEFDELKNIGQYFSWELERLLHVTYGPRHPIHHALFF